MGAVRRLVLLAGDPVLVAVEPPVEVVEPVAAVEVRDRHARLGSIVALLGFGVAAAVGFLLWAERTKRESGYLTTPTERFATSRYALTREQLVADPGGPNWTWSPHWLGKVGIGAESASAKPLFIGIVGARFRRAAGAFSGDA